MARTEKTQAEAKWRVLVAEWMRSGKSVAAFCRRRRVSAGSLYHWRRYLKVKAGAKAAPRSMPGFVEVKVAPEEPSGWWYENEVPFVTFTII